MSFFTKTDILWIPKDDPSKNAFFKRVNKSLYLELFVFRIICIT